MKKAICLSGHLRTYQKTSRVTLENIGGHDSDIFISTWDTTAPPSNWRNSKEKVESTDDHLNKLMEIYQPKLLEVEVFDDFKRNYADDLKRKKLFDSVEPMMYKIWRSNQLRIEYQKIKNLKYDFIVRLRFDLLVDKKIEYINLDNKLSVLPCHRAERISDIFSIAPPEIMDSYCDAYNHLGEFLQTTQSLYCAEALLNWHLKRNGIPVSLLKARINLIRENETTNWKLPISFL